MAPLCASNQPHSVYPHITPPDPSLSAPPNLHIRALRSIPLVLMLGHLLGWWWKSISIWVSLGKKRRRKGPHCHQKCQQAQRSLTFVMGFLERWIHLWEKELMYLQSAIISWCKDSFMCQGTRSLSLIRRRTPAQTARVNHCFLL